MSMTAKTSPILDEEEEDADFDISDLFINEELVSIPSSRHDHVVRLITMSSSYTINTFDFQELRLSVYCLNCATVRFDKIFTSLDSDHGSNLVGLPNISRPIMI